MTAPAQSYFSMNASVQDMKKKNPDIRKAREHSSRAIVSGMIDQKAVCGTI